MEQKKLNTILAEHKKWLEDNDTGKSANLSGKDLRHADLRDVDLKDVDLEGTNLKGAKLDFSCLPLWCGGLDFKIDEKQAKQLMYHVINLMQHSEIDTSKVIKKKMYEWLEDSHLVTKHKLPILKRKK